MGLQAHKSYLLGGLKCIKAGPGLVHLEVQGYSDVSAPPPRLMVNESREAPAGSTWPPGASAADVPALGVGLADGMGLRVFMQVSA